MSIKENNINKFKEMMGSYPTGVTVITANDSDGNPIGMTVNTFNSVSIDPLLILWSIRKDATEFDSFINTEQFIVNILDGGNTGIAKLFASKDNRQRRFKETNWKLSEDKLPILEDVSGIMECKIFDKIDAGDHILIVGEVNKLDKLSDNPMLFYKRDMGYIRSDWATLNPNI